MLLELVVTCMIGAGITYTPPEGWQFERVAFVGTRETYVFSPTTISHKALGYMTTGPIVSSCAAVVVAPILNNTVTLRRTVQVGEVIQAPEGCTMTTEAKDAVHLEQPLDLSRGGEANDV